MNNKIEQQHGQFPRGEFLCIKQWQCGRKEPLRHAPGSDRRVHRQRLGPDAAGELAVGDVGGTVIGHQPERHGQRVRAQTMSYRRAVRQIACDKAHLLHDALHLLRREAQCERIEKWRPEVRPPVFAVNITALHSARRLRANRQAQQQIQQQSERHQDSG